MQGRDGIVPVILGGGSTAYSVALAFYEEYGVISHAFMQYKCGATRGSKFIKTHLCSGLDDVKIAIPELLKFASENSSSDRYLIPTSDVYVAMLVEAEGVLSDVYRMIIPDRHIYNTLSDRSEIGLLMKKHRIDSLFSCPEDSVSKCDKSPVLKNASRDGGMRVLTTFSDSRGRVARAVYGDVILRGCGKSSVAANCAVITRPLDRICFELIDLLNCLSYKGFSSFDIVSNGRLKYVVEMKPWQGDCDYIRAAGVNVAELLVTDSEKGRVLPSFRYKEVYWHCLPHKSVISCSPVSAELNRADHLYRCGESYSLYENKFEGLARRLYVMAHNIGSPSRRKKL